MKYDITNILKNEGAKIDINECKSDSELGLNLGDLKLEGQICCKGSLTNFSSVIKFDADVTLSYSTKCARCLSGLERSKEFKISVNFPNSEETNDINEYCYVANIVNIGEVLNDSIVSELPIKHLCSEECEGLCHECGQDLNVSKCDCKKEEVDERLEALKKYFD